MCIQLLEKEFHQLIDPKLTIRQANIVKPPLCTP